MDYVRVGLLHLSALVGDVEYARFLVNLWKLDPNEEIGGNPVFKIAGYSLANPFSGSLNTIC